MYTSKADHITDLNSSPYISLLKRTLVDYHHVGREERYSLDEIRPSWKIGLLKPFDRWLRTRNFAICKVKELKATERRMGSDWPAKAMTMVGLERLNNVEFSIKAVLKDSIPGDLVETGVWRGGVLILMKALLIEFGDTSRQIWGFDSFSGVPYPNSVLYSEDATSGLHRIGLLAVSKNEVAENFNLLGIDSDKVHLVEGQFSETLPNNDIGSIAILRLDADLFESTHLALVHLYPKVSPGGFIIIDDYHSLHFCRTAVDQYRAAQGISEPLVDIDNEAVFWRKLNEY